MNPVNLILLAEDGEDDVVFMRHALKQAGIASALQTVGDGERAIAYLAGTAPFADRKKYPLPEIVFLDVRMPTASGFEVLNWIRLNLSKAGLKIVMLSSSDQAIDKEKADRLGAHAYVVKPPTPAILEALAPRLGLSWRRARPPGA